MIYSRIKLINKIKFNQFPYTINLIHIDSHSYRTLRPSTPSTTNHRERPHKPTQKQLRKSIPFVNNIKDLQDPDEALTLFNEYHQMGFKHDYPSYSALIYKLARSQKFEAVEVILNEVLVRNIRCGETLFIALIQHYGKAHLVEKAIEIFHKMPSFNCSRTLQSFNVLLNVLVDNDRFSDANDIFNWSHKMGLRPNSVSYNIMIKGWTENGDWENACNVFDQMLERKVQPSVVTYNSLIGFLCRKKGDLDTAMGLLEDMIEKGKHPNAVTYALLMEGLCSIGKYKEAKNLMFDMEYRGCKPRVVNYGVLMSDLGKRGKIEEAKSLLKEMKKRRFKPDVVIYNIQINYLCKEGRVSEAYKILIHMQVEGCEPNAATYRMIVDGFCQVGDFDGGLKVLNAMLNSRHCPRYQTFVCLVGGFMKCGKLDCACLVLEEMERRKMKFDASDWETLVTDVCDSDLDAGQLATELISAYQ